MTLVVLAGAIVAVYFAAGFGTKLTAKSSAHIARISIAGFITENREMVQLIEKIGKDDRVKGVIVSINSPGGVTVGGEALYEAVRQLAEKKPTVASVGGLAASAGYMIAAATDHIVARRSSLVGSIGVLIQYPDASKMMEMIGFKMEAEKSSPLKAEPSPFHPASEEAKAVLRDLVGDSYGWFRDLVKERRALSDAEVGAIATGRVFSGAQGLENKLIDAIGGEEEARKWLVEEKNLSDKLKTIEWKPPRDNLDLLNITTLAAWLGVNSAQTELAKELAAFRKVLRERIFLDGLLSVWHADSLKSVKEGELR